MTLCYRKILEENQCISLKELAVNGKDLIEAGYRPGPEIGEKLNFLLEHVLECPEDNRKGNFIIIIIIGKESCMAGFFLCKKVL